jgi:hypothetical protein
VDQVSRPLLAALIAVVGLAGAWMMVLRPKSDSAGPDAANPAAVTPAPAPATRPAAKRAAQAPEASAQERAEVSKSDPSAPILRELEKGKTAVLLFWNPLGADDRAALDAARKADRRGGKVTVRIADIEDVADYAAITRGVQVLQAPTTLVIGSDLKARAIVGYTETAEIDQLVGDARAKR